jgi:hypothetical protein
METILEQHGNLLSVSEADMYKILFDFREMDELILIIESFTIEPTQAELERLHLLPGGTENPDDDGFAKARNAQFELFLRAMFAQAKIGIKMGSPDLLISDGQVAFPIEAKRPSSPRRFDDRLRDAITQIQGQNACGVVAISLDHVIRPPRSHLGVRDQNYASAAAAKLVGAYCQTNLRRIIARLRGKDKVAALLFILRIPARVLETNLTVLGSNVNIAPVVGPGQSGYDLVLSLLKILERVRI